MNAGALPMGSAPHRLVRTGPDGRESIIGRFVQKDHADAECRSLGLLVPGNRYHVATETPVLPGLEGRV